MVFSSIYAKGSDSVEEAAITGHKDPRMLMLYA